nr:unnamed protein product [Digitaria exilis]
MMSMCGLPCRRCVVPRVLQLEVVAGVLVLVEEDGGALVLTEEDRGCPAAGHGRRSTCCCAAGAAGRSWIPSRPSCPCPLCSASAHDSLRGGGTEHGDVGDHAAAA